MTFVKLDPQILEARLTPPAHRVRVLIDTDAANEIDDQFAITWALLSSDKLSIEAITTEPFSFAHHQAGLLAAERAIEFDTTITEHLVGDFRGWIDRLHKQGRRAADLYFVDTAEGMELSFQEILRVYEKLGLSAENKVARGATHYLKSADTPVRSDSSEAIIDLAKSGKGEPLYIAAMGCVTNIASALLQAPEIIKDIVVVWTSAYPSCSPHCNRPSLNLVQDPHASRVMFDSGVPLVYLPGYQVGAQLTISLPEMERFVKNKGNIGEFLYERYTQNPLHNMFAIEDTDLRTWVIWDIIDIAWLLNASWVPSYLTSSPLLTEDLYWQKDPSRHLIREAYDIQRDEIYLDFYKKLDALAR